MAKALLIRDKRRRTITTLNLKRMLHGQEPDQPVRDHDILLRARLDSQKPVEPDMESAIQSAIGVTIYADWFIAEVLRAFMV